MRYRVILRRGSGAGSVQAEEPGEESLRGSEVILVVEDENMVRGVICRILRQSGY